MCHTAKQQNSQYSYEVSTLKRICNENLQFRQRFTTVILLFEEKYPVLKELS